MRIASGMQTFLLQRRSTILPETFRPFRFWLERRKRVLALAAGRLGRAASENEARLASVVSLPAVWQIGGPTNKQGNSFLMADNLYILEKFGLLGIFVFDPDALVMRVNPVQCVIDAAEVFIS
jgi:hypothetical protein